MNLVLLGPPGAGKGSLAKVLQEDYSVAHISTGDLLRAEMANKTDLGLKAKKCIENGELVSDELVTALVENYFKLGRGFENGYLLDGFPRTLKQAEDLDEILMKLKISLDHAIYMDADVDLVLMRLTGRRVCKNCGALYHLTRKPPRQNNICDECGQQALYQRSDDNEDTIRNRLDVYNKITKPIVEYYQNKGLLMTFDGGKETADLRVDLITALNK